MPKELQLIIKRIRGQKTEYVRHEGHQHFWTERIDEAMVYTNQQVAAELANKLIGVVHTL